MVNQDQQRALEGRQNPVGFEPLGSTGSRLWRMFGLTVLVHLDAFRLNPIRYLKATAWRMLGRRLRARNQLAALKGPSPRAYALWIASIEQQAEERLLAERPKAQILVIPYTRAEGCELAGLASVVAPEGTWFCFTAAGDLLAPRALEVYERAAAAAPDRWVIYADDDLISSGARMNPHFKSDWNPELFDNHDFITGSAIVRVTPDMLGSSASAVSVASVVREAISRGQPLHVPEVLHHRMWRPEAKLPAKPKSDSNRAVPSVAIIVPTRNRLPLLQTCIDGVRRTNYSAIEMIVVNNDSDDPETLRYLEKLVEEGVTVLEVGGPFNFSLLNNRAAAQAKSDLLCFLNNDVEITDPDWLEMLVLHATREDIGAVGARLLYPDGTVQHAGVVTGVGGGAAHAHRFMRDDEPGYFMRDRLPQRVSAVTAACLVVAKEKFIEVGGFDEADFPVAFNDVDLCLKLNERGWQSFYEPRAVLIHHESKSRGKDSAKENRVRFAGELAALKRKWGTDRRRDPYHHRYLSPFCEQFHIAL